MQWDLIEESSLGMGGSEVRVKKDGGGEKVGEMAVCRRELIGEG